MGLLLPLVLCAVAVCCSTRSVPVQVPSRSLLLPHGCNDSDVLAIAGLALQNINSDQKKGYVLSLNRVSNVQEHRQVYGQCKALFYVNKPRRVLYLPAYNCTLRPVSQRKIQLMCPDCPGPVDVSDPKVLEAVTETLAKFNKESTSKQYSLFKVVRASSQWVFGPSYFVKYLIKESPCTKSQASSCAIQSGDPVPVAVCEGSLSKTDVETFVSVTCNFFESQVSGLPLKHSTRKAQNQLRLVPGTAEISLGNIPLLKEFLFQENSTTQQNTEPTHSSSRAVPRGSVQYLPELDDENSGESQENGPVEAFPVQLDLTTKPWGETLDVSFLFLGPNSEQLVVLPFPKEEHRSAKCPGPAQDGNPLVLPP
ncbi:PREDICTED: fetuin-B isoform X2 [Miniopterus natalensis]|uniref:fetuin-B isoform X2 n=1 Tax=Miniopterus natalensis TaxID=291302 RepID=UPI0007A6E9F3|nr:PREDICTED: fetuin-B isoform X2 [Miniopterus natalensis]